MMVYITVFLSFSDHTLAFRPQIADLATSPKLSHYDISNQLLSRFWTQFFTETHSSYIKVGSKQHPNSTLLTYYCFALIHYR